MNREHRNLLMDGQLVLVSPYDPGAGFNVGNAMQRNKLIYALADAALVVSSALNKGGTWAGAVEQLEKLRLVPIYIRSTGEKGKGLGALRNLGAMDWPNPDDADGFEATLSVAMSSYAIPQTQDLLSLAVREPEVQLATQNLECMEPVSPRQVSVQQPVPIAELTLTPAAELFDVVRNVLLRILVMPKKEAEIAAELHVSAGQAKEWLQRLLAEGVLEKRTRPVSYVVRQVELFERLPAANVEQGETDA